MLNFVFTKKRGCFTVKTQMKFWRPRRSNSEGCLNHESYKAKASPHMNNKSILFSDGLRLKLKEFGLAAAPGIIFRMVTKKLKLYKI